MRIVRIIFILSMVIVSVFGFNKINEDSNLETEFLLENIEALANKDPENKYFCVGEGGIICPVTGKYVSAVYIQSR